MNIAITKWSVLAIVLGTCTMVQAQKPDTSKTVNVEPIPVNDVVNDLVDFAKTLLGTPYKWAGTTPSGFDCSGFIYYVMGNFGFSITRSSYGMADLGKTVALSEAMAGDLLFFKGRNVNSTNVAHVGMVIEVTPDKIMFIHSSTSKGVTIENLKGNQYFIPRYLKAKRLDYGLGH